MFHVKQYITRDSAAAVSEAAGRIRAIALDQRTAVAELATKLVAEDRQIPSAGRLISSHLLEGLYWSNGLIFSSHTRLVEQTGAPLPTVEDGIAALRREYFLLVESTPAGMTWRATLPVLIRAKLP